MVNDIPVLMMASEGWDKPGHSDLGIQAMV